MAGLGDSVACLGDSGTMLGDAPRLSRLFRVEGRVLPVAIGLGLGESVASLGDLGMMWWPVWVTRWPVWAIPGLCWVMRPALAACSAWKGAFCAAALA